MTYFMPKPPFFLQEKHDALARLDDGRIVAAREGNLLATAFHPELSVLLIRFHWRISGGNY